MVLTGDPYLCLPEQGCDASPSFDAALSIGQYADSFFPASGRLLLSNQVATTPTTLAPMTVGLPLSRVGPPKSK